MILLLLAAATAAPAAASAENPTEDIVVLARRLGKVRWSYHTRNGALVACRIERPSGSAMVDAMVCDASRQCARENPTLGDRHLAPCIKDRIHTLFTAYRDRASAG